MEKRCVETLKLNKQVPTNCMDENCPHNITCGLPDFPGTKEVCTVHYECALGYTKECTPRQKILLWYRGRKR